MVLRTQILFFILLLTLPGISQKKSSADKLLISNLRHHISYLADDKLEGRRLGTSGERLAQQYIVNAFRKEGLEPGGERNEYLQSFTVNDGRFYQQKSFLHINDDSLPVTGFFPMPQSPQVKIKVRCSIALKEIGVPWFLDLKDDMQAASSNPHFDFHNYLSEKAKLFSKKGASAILAYNSNPAMADLRYDPRDFSETLGIPVIFVSHAMAQKYFHDETATMTLNLGIGFTDSSRVGANVLGFINNGAPQTVVIGAHLDHLGYGEDGGSLLQTKEKLIHNGADDNASGVAAVIELSRLIKRSNFTKSNFLFIAFSGEEQGLLGSKFFAGHPTKDLRSMNYMLNLDMVGRLKPDSRSIIIGGYGTSPAWEKTFKKIKDRDLIPTFDSSGSGPSDHTSFYQKDIPVLFFFTGTHNDYHKPSDDAEKINYEGESTIIKYIIRLIGYNNKSAKLPFTKTIETPMENPTPFLVTLGIKPDYAYNGTGVRVDGITAGKPAEKAGLISGDVIVELGPHPISSLQNYMEALGKFQPGDTAKVKIKRNGNTVEATVQF